MILHVDPIDRNEDEFVKRFTYVAAVAALVGFTAPAFAGGLSNPETLPTVITTAQDLPVAGSLSSGSNLIVPLIALALLAAAVGGSSSSGT